MRVQGSLQIYFCFDLKSLVVDLSLFSPMLVLCSSSWYLNKLHISSFRGEEGLHVPIFSLFEVEISLKPKKFLKANIFAVFLFVLQVDPALKEKLKQNTVTLESEYEVK